MHQTLNPEALARLLDRPMRVLTYDTIDSTNNEAKRLIADELTEPALLVADSQTAGKGRLGRSFYSPAASGLYMSVILHPNAPPSEWISITSSAAVAVCLAVEALSELSPSIKWVNDVYMDRRKVCGILTEAVTDPASGRMRSVIIGIGLNLSTVSFPDEIADRASSLYAGGKPPFSREALAAAITNKLCSLSDDLPSGAWLPLYRERSFLDGKPICYTENNIAHTAVAVGIDEHGGLIVEDEAGCRRTLSSGEVTVRIHKQDADTHC